MTGKLLLALGLVALGFQALQLRTPVLEVLHVRPIKVAGLRAPLMSVRIGCFGEASEKQRRVAKVLHQAENE